MVVISFVFGDRWEDRLGESEEGFVDVHFFLRRGFQELHAQRVRELLAFLVGHLSLVLEVGLVADEDLDDVGARVLADLSEPVLDVLERLPVGDIVYQDAPVGAFVVGGGDGLKPGQPGLPLLSGGVPNLELYVFVVDFGVPDSEVHSDGRQERLVEYVIGVSAQNVRLSGTTVSDDENLENVLRVCVDCHSKSSGNY
jgi:hypothetical protein